MMTKTVNFDHGTYGYRSYGGSDQKISIELERVHYMLKRPQKLQDENILQSSYANNVISEYIGSHIMASLDIPTHETILGLYHGNIAVGCVDFCSQGERCAEFADFMRETYPPSEIGRFPTYKQLNEMFDKNDALSSLKAAGLERYWDTIIGDALIGNFDRHKGNWGYIVNENEKTIRLAPVYDCGSSLYANLAEREMEVILGCHEDIEKRMYLFPNIALNKNTNPRKEDKIGYFELLSGSFYDKNAMQSFQKIYPRINIKKIFSIIDETPYISDIRKQFYKEMVSYRKELILDKAYAISLAKGYIPRERPDLNTVLLQATNDALQKSIHKIRESSNSQISHSVEVSIPSRNR